MKIVAATKNKNKLREFTRLFAPLDIVVLPLDALDIDVEIAETGTTFLENARIKAQTIFELTGLASLADDSGLCVDALDGAPGIYSARYAGEPCDDSRNNQKLLAALEGLPMEQRTGRFVSAISCVMPTGVVEAEGTCEGKILTALQGDNGFGYDPLFLSDDFAAENRSFAQLTLDEKNQISHRGKAIALFLQRLEEHLKHHGSL